MSLCEKYPYQSVPSVLNHIKGKHGGIYNVGFQYVNDVPWTDYITGSADLLRGFFAHDPEEILITYFAVWKEGE